jgi:hypothetical protein
MEYIGLRVKDQYYCYFNFVFSRVVWCSSVCTRQRCDLTHETTSNFMVFWWYNIHYCYKSFFAFFADKSPLRTPGGRNTPVGQRALTERNATERREESIKRKGKYLYCTYFLFLLLYLTYSVIPSNYSASVIPRKWNKARTSSLTLYFVPHHGGTHREGSLHTGIVRASN